VTKMFKRFETWWKDKGQYECAPDGNGPGDVKAQIMKAYNAGWIHGSHDTEQVWIKSEQIECGNAYAQGRAEGIDEVRERF
jgi:hypothetical protein